MNTQEKLYMSVKRRGFHASPPPVATNTMQMELFLSRVSAMGTVARQLRKGPASQHMQPHANEMLRYPRLMAQMLRLTEEVGELAEAMLTGDIDNARIETADAYVVLCQISTLILMDLDETALAKAAADEERGLLHGEAIHTNGAVA